MEIESLLAKYKIVPDPAKDQFFLNDREVVERMVSLAELNRNDVVLEIGAGAGVLIRRLAEKSRKVIAFEIDERFKPFLKDLPKNVELHLPDPLKAKNLGLFLRQYLYQHEEQKVKNSLEILPQSHEIYELVGKSFGQESL